jgi:uncharacterized membrane protein YphA (DoxX/SURF4 family)
MNNLFIRMQRFAPVINRVGVSLVFLWFGSQQILHSDAWVSFIPSWATSLSGLSTLTLLHINGAFEIVFGLCLFAGYFTRVSALLLALHMLDIIFIVGYTSIGVRDFGIFIATASVFIYGSDSWSLDNYLNKY